MLRNGCHLITYPDSLGSNLTELRAVLRDHFQQAVCGVHLLPFYPSSGDRGFAPLGYEEVDPAFGGWEDVEALGNAYDLIVDFMVNHISRRSPFFKDYLEKGAGSTFAEMFLRLGQLAPRGISKDAYAALFKRKPTPPWVTVRPAGGAEEQVWCTFDDEQIDLDVESPIGREFIRRSLLGLAAHGVKMIRLDAFAYAIKRLGTSCFFVEPQTSKLLHDLHELLAPHGVELLPEIHERHHIQLALAAQGYWVYDFNLPLLVLQALYDGSSANLVQWARICPRKQITTLDTHDGLPVLDVADLMRADDLERTKENLFSQGANVQRRYSVDPAYKNRNVYQLNCTYYSALGEHDDAYLAARAIQFFFPGIPQVYYVGLLAGRNDTELVEQTKFGRNINRHNYGREEIRHEAQRSVVQRLLRLMIFRNTFPAFGGELSIGAAPDSELVLMWSKADSQTRLCVDLRNRRARISVREGAASTWKELEL